MRLYLTRHGQTEWNLERRMQGWKDSPLTELGISNAKALGKHLKDVNFSEIYSSSVQRAVRTAELVRGDKDIPIILDDNLREIGVGDWEGQVVEDIKQNYAEEYGNFWKKPHLYKRDNVETFHDVQERAVKVVKEIVEKHKGTDDNVLIVTHTITLKSIMAYFEGRDIEKLWEPPYIYDTSLSLVEITEEGAKILLHGDVAHLEELVKISYLVK
ncbi:histidine phosphatase family protein [Clostridium omnivorum]|uniref:Phosphatase n=1 Tax=Clostridium omnivorum TaxID=1604902 RepID=A0ABQ5N5W6_9CLOT|nr:histidine phosphatase family protein [Clostridium sp. E14]GLC30611.1 phosphatase [Clostridium sp. E14]